MFLLIQFLSINGHFTLNLLAALVFFAVAWLYFDAWLGRHDYREGTKSLGFILLSISFVIHATAVESHLISSPIISSDISGYLISLFRISAYIVLIIGQLVDPIQPLPSYRYDTAAVVAIPLSQGLTFSYPLLAISTSILYLHRATVGLEHHLKPISWSLGLLAISDTIGLAASFRETSDIAVASLVAPFGPLWIIEHAILLIAISILGRWVWSYLVKRLETQLLMIFTTLILIIFLLTTIFFTTTSIDNLRIATLENLQINAQVLKYSLESKMSESLSDAQLVAQNADVKQALADNDIEKISSKATSILLTKNQSFMVITGKNGEIIVRADDPDKVSGSLSEDLLVKKALTGESVSGVTTNEGILAPEVSVRGATPIKNGDEIIGTVMVGTVVDNAFVDGLKKATGLDASIYAGNVRSATTFVSEDGKTRWIGVKEESDDVKKNVLVDNNIYTGSINILNVPYYSAFIPLTNLNGTPIGMVFVGTPQISLIESASRSIELTFLVTAGLLILSIFPSFIVSRYIIAQIL